MSDITEATIRERIAARPPEYIFSRSEVEFLLGLVDDLRRINRNLHGRALHPLGCSCGYCLDATEPIPPEWVGQ